MTARLLGIGLFVLAAVLAVGYYLLAQGDDGSGDPVTAAIFGERPAEIEAMGFVGGEKTAFLANPEVQEILEEDYGITLDARRAGSLEMVSEAALIDQAPDFYWPASQVSVEIARDNGIAPVQTEIVFNAPIVLYSWSPVAAALESEGLARPLTPERAAFAIDTRALLERVLAEESWASLGLDRLYGGVMITSTNPLFSNSGNQFAMLAAMVLSGGETSGPAFQDAVGKVASIYERMGYTERSSSTLFEQYLRQGMGAYPLVAGYESQLIEFAAADRDLWQSLEGREIRPVILYPEPTVFSSHVLLAMGEPGRAVIGALRDERLQDLAWAQHGFRSGFAPANDPSILPLAGIPDTVGMVIPMPPFSAVQAILAAIGQSQG